ncbi:prolyl oligopeptidase family serine peptidase [Vibrio sp. SS-MA-C1-2]|uniref:alpha/beta hydrolase family protein n=1 Tax=Vibrio sp. SS-MA-C1-2 TaxID=2908646 RepID=UPI001F21DC2A|nr:CocE/NonD family hydrolase [Vibrio sp. SS-MA-C1-2]UJF17614.1 prolyl oligopeptidase family serine peptidase [Vibrio sp. SS-MA-C1-2]
MVHKIKNKVYLIISLLLCLISAWGASIIQSDNGHVTIKDMRWETASGQLISALLYLPDSAVKSGNAPGVVTSHGWYNNREFQDLNNIELSRRGYVVISIDMYGHGNSDPVTSSEWRKHGTGLYDAVLLISELPYIDKSRIGITGHSNGARASNWAILDDKEGLISSVLLIANDAMYTSSPDEPMFWASQPKIEDRDYVNRYGDRDVGIVAAQFDEFFFRSKMADGTVSPPKNYIHTHAA